MCVGVCTWLCVHGCGCNIILSDVLKLCEEAEGLKVSFFCGNAYVCNSVTCERVLP